MFEWIQTIGQIVVLLYVVSAMIVIGLTKIGGSMASITKSPFVPDSHREINGWSRRTKLIHIAIFLAACVVAFWRK